MPLNDLVSHIPAPLETNLRPDDCVRPWRAHLCGEAIGEPHRREPACPGPAGGSRLSAKTDGRRPAARPCQAGGWTHGSALPPHPSPRRPPASPVRAWPPRPRPAAPRPALREASALRPPLPRSPEPARCLRRRLMAAVHPAPAVTSVHLFRPRVSLERASPHVHVLIPRSRDYVTWHSRRDFAGRVKLKIWR